MTESNRKASWAQTSHLMWIIAEVNRHKTDRKRPYDPREFNPTFEGKIPRGNPITREGLKAKAAAWRKSKGLEAT